MKVFYEINIVLFLGIDGVKAESLSQLGLDVVVGHLLDLGESEDGLLGRLVQRGHPTEAALVSSHIPHTEVHYRVDLAVKVKLQLLQEDVLGVGLGECVQFLLGDPLVVEEGQGYAVRLCYVGVPLETFN